MNQAIKETLIKLSVILEEKQKQQFTGSTKIEMHFQQGGLSAMFEETRVSIMQKKRKVRNKGLTSVIN